MPTGLYGEGISHFRICLRQKQGQKSSGSGTKVLRFRNKSRQVQEQHSFGEGTKVVVFIDDAVLVKAMMSCFSGTVSKTTLGKLLRDFEILVRLVCPSCFTLMSQWKFFPVRKSGPFPRGKPAATESHYPTLINT